MKIIIVNYRYFVSGGPERYLFNIMSLLEKEGHTVIPFSIKGNRNEPTAYDSFFLDPVSDGDEVYFGEYKKTPATVIKSFSRMFYSFEAKKKLGQLIEATQPDIVYVLHYQNKISASIFDAAVKYKVPIVHRISDFGQICANALFFRPNQKDICERCLNGSKVNAVINKCVYDSYIYSALKAASIELQRLLNIKGKINAFVVPSKFTLEKLAQAGFHREKLNNIPTFFNFETIKNADTQTVNYQPFAVYIGRIESEKGLMSLVKAFENTELNLKIIGFSSTGYDFVLKDYLKDKKHNIEFLGKMNFDQIQDYLSRCLFTIVPSEWYDNFPNTILESFAFRKCVIATNVGSLKEIVIDKETGLLFNLRDIQDLRNKIIELFNKPELCIEYGNNAYNKLRNEFSSQIHYNKLMSLFKLVISSY